MSKSTAGKTSRVAQFISLRIDELRPRRSQLEIATAAGLRPNMLSMIKDGKAKLPMERVVPLAKALECEPAELTMLALEQFYEPQVLDAILATATKREVSRELDVVATWAIVLGVEVRAALRDVKFAKQYASSAASRAERLDERLERIKVELDDLIIAARTPGALLKVR